MKDYKHSIGDLVYCNIGPRVELGIVQAYYGQGEAVPRFRVNFGSQSLLVRADYITKNLTKGN